MIPCIKALKLSDIIQFTDNSVDYTKNTTLTDQEIIGLEIDASALGGVLMNHLNR